MSVVASAKCFEAALFVVTARLFCSQLLQPALSDVATHADCSVLACSGRYSLDVPIQTRDPVFKKLASVTSSEFDAFVGSPLKSGQLVLIACVREDDPYCRRIMQVMSACLFG